MTSRAAFRRSAAGSSVGPGEGGSLGVGLGLGDGVGLGFGVGDGVGGAGLAVADGEIVGAAHPASPTLTDPASTARSSARREIRRSSEKSRSVDAPSRTTLQVAARVADHRIAAVEPGREPVLALRG